MPIGMNYHEPACHNERVKALIKRFEIKLDKARGERDEIIFREDQGEALCPPDIARCSDLFLATQEHARTIWDLNNLLLPLEN